MIEIIMQAGLAVTGLATIVILAIGRPPWVFVGCCAGTTSQIFWFWTALHPLQPGLLFLAVCYTVVYVLGVIGHRPIRRGAIQ